MQACAGAAGQDNTFSICCGHVRLDSFNMWLTPSFQGASLRPNACSSLAVFRRELCDRLAAVGKALDATALISFTIILGASCPFIDLLGFNSKCNTCGY